MYICCDILRVACNTLPVISLHMYIHIHFHEQFTYFIFLDIPGTLSSGKKLLSTFLLRTSGYQTSSNMGIALTPLVKLFMLPDMSSTNTIRCVFA